MNWKNTLAALVFTGLGFAAAALAVNTVSVIVQKTSIRKDSQFFAPTVAEAKHKDQLTVIEEKGAWLKVSHQGKEGWIHISAVSSRAVGEKKGVLSFGREEAAKVSEDEVTLAGKGFSKQVEDEYKKQKPGLNFAAVDAMERVDIPLPDLAAFAAAGNLEGREEER